MNFEFLDDAYKIYTDDDDANTSEVKLELFLNKTGFVWCMTVYFLLQVWEDNGKLAPNALPYSYSSNIIKENHPLQVLSCGIISK